MTVAKYVLTTLDNPFNPVTQFDEWNTWDTQHGYHTLSYLARVCLVSEDMSEPDQSAITQDSIDEIVKLNINGMYTKVLIPDDV